MSCSDRQVVWATAAVEDGSDDVANDAMQLLQIAVFNGLCRTLAALAENGLISDHQLENIYDCMTAPLDDPGWRDDRFIASTRETLQSVLAQALTDARNCVGNDRMDEE